jgi:AcrR family transcriptional regulator
MSTDPNPLRERTRRAVSAEISQAAERLFIERGYEATTVDDIADEVGMSPRSIYRYFPTKDDLLIGRFAEATERVLEVLRSRPETEPVWESLRAAFTPLADHADSQPDIEATRRIHRTVFTTPVLTGRYLQQVHLTELAARDVLRPRLGVRATDSSAVKREVALFALITAAFGSLVTAQQVWSTQDGTTTVAELLDLAMGAIQDL